MSTTRRRRGRAALALGCALLALSGCSTGPGAGPAADPGPRAAPLVPDEGAYLGIFYGDRPQDETDAAIGRTPQIHLTYVGWTDEWATSDVLAEDAARGQLSLVNWEPVGLDFAELVAGRYDDLLVTRARQAGELDHQVFVDFAAEMNEEEGWGGHDPALYVAAYRHLHDVFAEHDGGNVVWVWAPNNTDSDGEPGAVEYYPGDDYVDWTGIDGYNWGTGEAGFTWQGFDEVFGPVYEQLAALGKPVMIGETSSAEVGGSKPDWIADLVPTLQRSFPEVRALVWFDVDKERDWRIGSSPATAAAFAATAADPYLSAPVP